MKKAATFRTSTPWFVAIRRFLILVVILLYLLPLAIDGRLLSDGQSGSLSYRE